jgi:ABC-type uncharacterized transport system substrate-binding protein
VDATAPVVLDTRRLGERPFPVGGPPPSSVRYPTGAECLSLLPSMNEGGGGIMATHRIGLLAQGHPDPARDFPEIMTGLSQVFNIANWSADWSEKRIWDPTAATPAAITFLTNPSPITPATNHVDVLAAFAEGARPNLTALAQHLVGLSGTNKLELFVGTSTPALLALHAAMPATDARPVIMAFSGDPEGAGLYTDETDRQTKNRFTGLTDHVPSQAELQVQALTVLHNHWTGSAPNPRLHILHTDTDTTHVDPNPGKKREKDDVKQHHPASHTDEKPVNRKNDLIPGTLSPKLNSADMVLVMGDPLIFQNEGNVRTYFNTRATKIPVIYWAPEVAERGGLMACGPRHDEIFRRAGYFVKRILADGKTPSELPVEAPNDAAVKLVLNQTTCTAWGKTFPKLLLKAADSVISATAASASFVRRR